MKSDVQQNFACLICTQIANNAVQTFCCGQVMCEQCSNDLQQKFKTCPNCRQQLSVRASSIARRLISNIKIPCKHDCGSIIAHKELKNHQRKCLIKPIKCRLCEKEFRQKEIIQHMREDHFEELYQMCLDFHLGSIEQVLTSKISGTSSKLHDSKIKNSKGKVSQIGTTGKYYCGGDLKGKCLCCNGKCGPTNGENCDYCMAQDMKRFNLSKGYLVNPDGIPSQLNPQTKAYSCGRNMKSFICDSQKTVCQSCGRLARSIKIGRYLDLI